VGWAWLLAVLTACSVSVSTGGDQLDVEEGEQLFKRQLEERTGAAVERVDCPERKIKKGDTFTCTAIVEGQSLRLAVTQTDDEGTVDGQPEQALLSVEKATTAIESSIREQTGIAAQVDCGDKAVLVKDVGATFDCTARAPDGSTRRVAVTVKDLEGNVDFRLV
jgi:hypothetical protein